VRLNGHVMGGGEGRAAPFQTLPLLSASLVLRPFGPRAITLYDRSRRLWTLYVFLVQHVPTTLWVRQCSQSQCIFDQIIHTAELHCDYYYTTEWTDRQKMRL